MTIYYHDTTLDKLASIETEGLVPQANYRLTSYLQINKKLAVEARTSKFLAQALLMPQTYLWRPEEKGGGTNVRLKIDVPNNIAVTKDYEQLIFFYLGMVSSGVQQNMDTFNRILSDFGSKLRVDGTSFEKDIKTIMKVMDGINDEKWDAEYGAYRTNQTIDAKCIEIMK